MNYREEGKMKRYVIHHNNTYFAPHKSIVIIVPVDKITLIKKTFMPQTLSEE